MSIEQEAVAQSGQDFNSPTQDIVFPQITAYQLALQDIQEGICHWRIWLMLAYQDIKLRYRRSLLGPFWITISMAITVYTMGYLYSHIFHIELANYYPFLVAGMLSWSLISQIVLDTSEGFMSSDVYIKQVKLPYTLYIHRLAARNMIIFFHNLLVMVPIYIIFYDNVKINYNTLLIFPGLAIIYINAISYGLIFAMIGGRYRDISQVTKSLVQVVFFVTPVLWKPDVLSAKNRFYIDLNPFYAFIEAIRAPLLGNILTINNVIVITIVTLLGLTVSAFMFQHYRARIVYWL